MARSKYGHRTTDAFAGALERAAKDGDQPQPLCAGRTAEFSDYSHVPGEQEAADLCAGCPLITLCLDNAKRTKMKWGIWGGVAWVGGRQAHLIPADSPDWDEWVFHD